MRSLLCFLSSSFLYSMEAGRSLLSRCEFFLATNIMIIIIGIDARAREIRLLFLDSLTFFVGDADFTDLQKNTI